MSDGSDGASRNYFTRRRRRGAEVWLSGEHQTSALSSAVTNSHLKMSERTNRDSQIGGGQDIAVNHPVAFRPES